MAKQDMFGIPDEDNNHDNDDGAEGGADYVILQVTPAEGWRVVFHDPTMGGAGNPTAIRTLGLACFALVEIVPDQVDPQNPQLPMRAIRPMVATEYGQVEDVETFEDFICVVPPGIEIQPTVDFAIRTREAAQK